MFEDWKRELSRRCVHTGRHAVATYRCGEDYRTFNIQHSEPRDGVLAVLI